MGLNINVHRVTPNDSGADFKSLKGDEWDSIRHSGDREFALYKPMVSIAADKNDPTSDWIFHRPSNIADCIVWVNNNNDIPDVNKPRLINILSRMNVEHDLWFYFGY